ncbi:MAG TPA: FecR domain-containing protein, partial [Fodinibius sp.]|nr:FecR domain-containing protein [Fodinibius sp.]
WLAEDPANRAFFEELRTRWQETPDENGAYRSFLFDRESGASRLRHKLREERDREVTPVRNLSVSARSQRFTGWKIAASILLVIGVISAWAGMRFWTPPVTSYTTSNIEQRIITLPDGSTVRLNRNSTISFQKGLSGPARKVTLQGEAFFKVAHKADRPFIIHTGHAVIRDIGTSFNVKQQKDGRVVVAMKEGRATLRGQQASRKEAAMLTKNNVGILDKGHVTTTTQDNIQNYLGWMEGRLVFKSTSFAKVVRQLDHIYGIHSQLADSSLSALTLTAYTQDTSLSEVLDMIALSLEIKYQRKGQTVVWKKKRTARSSRSKKVTDTIVTED